MSDHLHISSVQGCNREQENAYGWREENRISREGKDRKWDEIKEMFGKMVLNQNKDKRFEEERPIHRRKIYNSHYQRKEGMCFKSRSIYYSIEPEVYILYFDGNKNVEDYLEWETKLDQTFKKYKMDEYTRFFLATLCFQEYNRSWWQQRQLDDRIGTPSKLEYWSDLKECVRRKFVPPSYDRKRNIREEMKELVRIGRKFVDGKNYARREKEFKEKLQVLVRKKEEK